jgi:hypothetical protein
MATKKFYVSYELLDVIEADTLKEAKEEAECWADADETEIETRTGGAGKLDVVSVTEFTKEDYEDEEEE